MNRVFWTCLPLALLAVLTILSAPVSSGGQWNAATLTPEELYARFGSEEAEISLRDALKLLLRLVNEDRERAGLEALAWDRVASYAAEEHAREMAEHHYLSHLNLNGEKPNLRYNRHGGTDQVTENVSYWESDIRLYLTPQVVEDIHRRWMESEAHRRNILSPHHTAVGIAIVLEWNRSSSVLTAAEEFVAAFGRFQPLPLRAGRDEKLELRGEFYDRSYRLAYVAVGYEPLPERQVPEYLNANLNGYSLPKPFAAIMQSSDRHRQRVEGLPTLYLLASDPNRGRFGGRLSVQDLIDGLREAGRARQFAPGLYYFMVWAQPPEGGLLLVSTQVVRVEQ